MNLPVSNFQPKNLPEPPAMVRSALREDVLWNRPVFKAPPLDIKPQPFDATLFSLDLPRASFGQH